MRAGVIVGLLLAAAAGAGRRAQAQQDPEPKPCDPACGADETCVDGVCMVPAQPAPQPAAAAAGQVIEAEPPAVARPVGPSSGPGPAPLSEAASGFVALPYLGLNSFHGDGTDDIDP